MIPEVNLSWYSLYFTVYNIKVDAQTGVEVDLTLTSMLSGRDTAVHYEKFQNLVSDMNLMNTARSSTDPRVVDALNQLLTMVALTN